MVCRVLHVILFLLSVSSVWGDGVGPSVKYRYFPNVDASVYPEFEDIAVARNDAYTRSNQNVVDVSAGGPLAGLKLALDPGHIGGEWSMYEQRNFRIAPDDYWVREGDLVLEVAFRIRDALTKLGAEVILLRNEARPVNRKPIQDYIQESAASSKLPSDSGLPAMADYANDLMQHAVRKAIIPDEIAARARRINTEIRPDLAISLHMNAAVWPQVEGDLLQLVDTNHLHVLIFGCVLEKELQDPLQRQETFMKVRNGSGAVEYACAASLANALADATALPPSVYSGSNAQLLDVEQPYVWARNLMFLRKVECPVIMLEPYIANSTEVYPRIQHALQTRAEGIAIAEDDILVEYADAVVAGLLEFYSE